MLNPIITPRDFFSQIARPDCEDAIAVPDDVRKVLHACMSLHHLRDWVFNAGLAKFNTEKEFSEDLYKRCPELKIIRAIAINSKHSAPTTAPMMTVGTSAAAAGAWGESWGESWGKTWGRIQAQVLGKTEDGESYWVKQPLCKAFEFWKREFEDNKW